MSSVSSILGQAEANNASKTSNEYADNKQMFLTLLVAQLSNQDPLNPAEDTEYIAQLAQFTQVEELQNLNTSMTSLLDAYEKQQFVAATNLLGTRVLSAGTTISKVTTNKETGEYATTPIYYTTESDLSNCTVNVYGAGGYTIYSEEIGSIQAGSYSFTWDGTNSLTGLPVNNGIYEFAVVAYDLNGNRVLTKNEVFGDVVQVEKADDGYYLHMYDGRSVKLDDVTMTGYTFGSEEEDKKEEGATPPDGTTPEGNTP